MTQKITEEELEYLFRSHKPVKKSRSLLKLIIVFVIFFVLILILINLPAFSSNFNYWFKTNVNNFSYEDPVVGKTANGLSPTVNILNQVPLNSIYIDKLNLKAPINFDIPNETEAVKTGLEGGVIHIRGTAHPGEIGNVFITGHSSNYFWAKGSYNHVFSLLNNLEVNDYLTINYKNIIYIYRISDKFIISPDEIGVLKQTDKSELTLMTCYPIGTNINRLIVKAIQIKPDPSSNQKKAPSSLDYLPNIKR